MKTRSVVLVVVLSIITFGIYAIVWHVKSKDEMNACGASIPTAWLLIIPIANIWWLWKFGEGVEAVTNKQMTGVVAFILLFVLGLIGMAIVQSALNKVAKP
jgi:hypothetical protein